MRLEARSKHPMTIRWLHGVNFPLLVLVAWGGSESSALSRGTTRTVDIVAIAKVAVYSYDERGTLSFVGTVADSGAGPCWAVVNHAGTRLYVTNAGDTSVGVYDLTNPLNLVEIHHFVMASTTGAAFSTVIDSSDQWLYVSSEQSSTIATTSANAFHSLKVMSDGTLTEPFAPAILPIGVSVPVRAEGITVVGAN